MDRTRAQNLIHSLKSLCWAININDVCPDIAAKWNPEYSGIRRVEWPSCQTTPAAFTIPELMDQIAAVDEASYRSMLSIPQFARSLTPGRIVDFMIGFGKTVKITTDSIAWVNVRNRRALTYETIIGKNFIGDNYAMCSHGETSAYVYATHWGHLPAWAFWITNPNNEQSIEIKIAERLTKNQQIIHCDFKYGSHYRTKHRFRFPI